MIWLVIGSQLALAAAFVVLVVVAYRRRATLTWWDEVVRSRVLVHTRDGQTFDGQLVRVDPDGVVLEPATLLDGPHQLKGRVFIARERIGWWQHPDRRPVDDE